MVRAKDRFGAQTIDGDVWLQEGESVDWMGFFLEGDGGPKPYRAHWRTPSFSNLQALSWVARGHYVADLIAIIGSIDFVLGDTDR